MIELALAKQHLRLTDEESDGYLQLLVDTAQENCIGYLNRPVYATQAELTEADPEGAGDGIVVTPVIQWAMLMTIGHLYENRQDASVLQINKVPQSSRWLLNQYRLIPGV